MMSRAIGKRAIVVGAGMGGLTVAAVLAGHFERVLVLESDALPTEPADRPGIPQGRHVHALLAGGLVAFDELFHGFGADLARAGAQTLRAGLDIRAERPGFDPFPQRDLGFDLFAMSRALLECLVRERVRARPNVDLRSGCRVEALAARPDGAAVTGVRCGSETLEADFVVDASARGHLTLDLLEATGRPRPEETTVGVDLQYASATFETPADAPADWKGVFHFPFSPRTSKGALLLPLEGGRFILTVAGRHGETPGGDVEGFMAFVRQFRTPTILRAIESAKRLGEITRFGFRESRYRHFDRLSEYPRGLLTVGDAMCRFNPVYGQGMSVAAQEAVALGRLLAERSGQPDPLDGLASPFFAEAARLIDTPWFGSVVPDFIHPETRGTRPADLEAILKFGMTLTRLAARDPAVHKLTVEVSNLLKPRSAYLEPELLAKIAEMRGATP